MGASRSPAAIRLISAASTDASSCAVPCLTPVERVVIEFVLSGPIPTRFIVTALHDGGRFAVRNPAAGGELC